MHELKAVHYTTEGIYYSECTILKYTQCVRHNFFLFLVTSSFSQANILKLTRASVHTLLISLNLVTSSDWFRLVSKLTMLISILSASHYLKHTFQCI